MIAITSQCFVGKGKIILRNTAYEIIGVFRRKFGYFVSISEYFVSITDFFAGFQGYFASILHYYTAISHHSCRGVRLISQVIPALFVGCNAPVFFLGYKAMLRRLLTVKCLFT